MRISTEYFIDIFNVFFLFNDTGTWVIRKNSLYLCLISSYVPSNKRFLYCVWICRLYRHNLYELEAVTLKLGLIYFRYEGKMLLCFNKS